MESPVLVRELGLNAAAAIDERREGETGGQGLPWGAVWTVRIGLMVNQLTHLAPIFDCALALQSPAVAL